MKKIALSKRAKECLLVLVVTAALFCIVFAEPLSDHIALRSEGEELAKLFLSGQYEEANEYGCREDREYRLAPEYVKMYWASKMIVSYENGDFAEAYDALETCTEDYADVNAGRKYERIIQDLITTLESNREDVLLSLYDHAITFAKEGNYEDAYQQIDQFNEIDRSFLKAYKDAYNLYRYLSGWHFYQTGNMLYAEDYLCHGVNGIDESIVLQDPALQKECRSFQEVVLQKWRAQCAQENDKPSSNHNNHSSNYGKEEDEFPAWEYQDPEDFYDDYNDDFFDYEDAEDYWYEHNGD